MPFSENERHLLLSLLNKSMVELPKQRDKEYRKIMDPLREETYISKCKQVINKLESLNEQSVFTPSDYLILLSAVDYSQHQDLHNKLFFLWKKAEEQSPSLTELKRAVARGEGGSDSSRSHVEQSYSALPPLTEDPKI